MLERGWWSHHEACEMEGKRNQFDVICRESLTSLHRRVWSHSETVFCSYEYDDAVRSNFLRKHSNLRHSHFSHSHWIQQWGENLSMLAIQLNIAESQRGPDLGFCLGLLNADNADLLCKLLFVYHLNVVTVTFRNVENIFLSAFRMALNWIKADWPIRYARLHTAEFETWWNLRHFFASTGSVVAGCKSIKNKVRKVFPKLELDWECKWIQFGNLFLY